MLSGHCNGCHRSVSLWINSDEQEAGVKVSGRKKTELLVMIDTALNEVESRPVIINMWVEVLG